MGFEIDFLPIGNNEKGGDAIALRFGNLRELPQEQIVMVIDGGTQETGEALVEHIRNYYKTNHVNFVVSTHPDADHASGLTVVLEQLEVGGLLMHLPWKYADEIKNLFKDGRITTEGLEKKLIKSLQNARDLETLANKEEIPIYEPFAGSTALNKNLHILGPSKSYYESLLPHFRRTPKPKEEINIFQKTIKTGREIIEWVAETIDIETLDDTCEHFSAENSSSVIMLLTIYGHKILFTGDADINALVNALNYAKLRGIDLSNLHLLDVPHHGSKHNVGPTILNMIKAQKSQISAPREGDPKHPSRKVINALIRRGSIVYATKGGVICHPSLDAPKRERWGPAQELPFYNQVEK